MTSETFSDWLTNPEFTSKGSLAVFNNGDRDYLVCRDNFACLPEKKDDPEMVELIEMIEKSTIVSPVASQDEIDRLSNSETK